MTANSNSGNGSTDEPDLPTRNDVLDGLSVAINEAREKIESGRIRDPENEKVRIQWIQALSRASSEYRKVLNDRDDLDDLRERVEVLEDDDETSDYRFK